MGEMTAVHDVHPNQMSLWKRQAAEALDEVFINSGDSTTRCDSQSRAAQCRDTEGRSSPCCRP